MSSHLATLPTPTAAEPVSPAPADLVSADPVSASSVSTEPVIDLDPDIGVWEPGLTTIDLTKFEGLSADQQRKVIIRVLCGLVALEEDSPEPAHAPAPERPDPLPFTDTNAGDIDLRKLPPPPPVEAPPARRRLPFFGLRRPF